MNELLDKNISYTAGIILLGISLLSIFNSYASIRNFHSRSISRNFFFHITTSFVDFLRNIKNANKNKISVSSFLTMNATYIVSIITVFYTIIKISKDEQLESMIVIYICMLNSTLLSWYYKKQKMIKGHDLYFFNYIYILLIFSLNLVVTEHVGNGTISKIGNTLGMFYCFYMNFYLVKEVFSKAKNNAQAYPTMLYLVSLYFLIAAFFHRYINFIELENELLEVLSMSTSGLFVCYYFISSQVKESTGLKNKIVFRSIVTFTLFLTTVRIICWSI